jgi:hypothetical protein
MLDVRDHLDRPLLMVRDNGHSVFYRYVDMAKAERDFLLEFFDRTSSSEFATKQQLEDFLDFKNDRKPCG